MVREGDRYYLFFEYMNTASSRGEIGVAESLNGYDWRFNGMHHLSAIRRKRGGWIAAVDGNGVPQADESPIR